MFQKYITILLYFLHIFTCIRTVKFLSRTLDKGLIILLLHGDNPFLKFVTVFNHKMREKSLLLIIQNVPLIQMIPVNIRHSFRIQ